MTSSAEILIIEDEKQVRQSYQEMFTYFGYNVDVACNGTEGLRLINKKDYDVVVTDLNMPEMNGIEVLKYIKKRKPYIEVIVITGYATLENAIQAMKIGAYDYFTKPVDLEHVRIVISKCIQQIKAKRENEELKELNAKLRDLNELKNKFITITNHELRTPITVVKGYLELLEYFLNGSTSQEFREAMNIISDTMEELVDIVDQMHDFSSFDNGKNKLCMKSFAVDKLLSVIYKEMKILFDKRKIDFKLEMNAPIASIKGDYQRIKRSIREIVQNALKFTQEGGKVTIRYSLNECNKNVNIQVIDNGIGIPADKHELIFEPFYEVQSTIHHTTSKTKFMGGGIGLGLTLAKEIVEIHQGKIYIESEENKGSTFTVVLPSVHIEEREPVLSEV
jgi:signal transduction histidine kinase